MLGDALVCGELSRPPGLRDFQVRPFFWSASWVPEKAAWAAHWGNG